jgi:hypothetical protein
MTVSVQGGEPAVLASGQGCAQALAVYESTVYWINYDAASKDGAVMKVPADGGPPVVLALAPGVPVFHESVAVGPAGIFWLQQYEGDSSYDLMKLGLSGGTAVKLASSPDDKSEFAGSLTLHGDNLYWSDYISTTANCPAPRLLRVGVDGAGAAVATPGRGGDDLEISGANVYWVSACCMYSCGGLSRIGLSTLEGEAGAEEDLYTSGLGNPGPNRIALDASHVYFTRRENVGFEAPNPLTRMVQRVGLDGGVPETVADGQDACDIAVDGTAVYWITSNKNGQGTVVKLAK